MPADDLRDAVEHGLQESRKVAHVAISTAVARSSGCSPECRLLSTLHFWRTMYTLGIPVVTYATLKSESHRPAYRTNCTNLPCTSCFAAAVQAVWPTESDVATFFLVKLLHIVQTFFIASADTVTAALVGPTLHTLGPVAFHVWKQDVSQRDKESAWSQLSGFLLSLPASGGAANVRAGFVT
jgi:hypothetical protein